MPSGSTVSITYDGVDLTNKVLWATAKFNYQFNAIPGTFEFTVKDVDHDQEFVTGKEVVLEIDGVRMFGGFGIQIQRGYPFSAMDTTDPATVVREWTIRGVDFNILFDKRVLRNPADYTTQIPNFAGDQYDGDLIKLMCDQYLDVGDIDFETFVDNIRPPFDDTPDASQSLGWKAQGTQWRKQMEQFTQFTGALWYLDAYKALHHHAIENTVMRWGFSDKPNKGGITDDPNEFQGSTIGPREYTATEDGTRIVNDAFVWGGSAPIGNDVVFARETNSGSITDHGRWQLAETHFGEQGYSTTPHVANRADLIVNGSPGAVGADQNRGLKYPQWNFRFAWFAHQVPTIDGNRNHVLPGYLSTIVMEVFGPEGDPLVQLLPCRTLAISFPNLDPSGNGYVRFDGFFGLQPDDPFSLWSFLLGALSDVKETVITVVDDDSVTTDYGAIGHFTPSPLPDDTTTVFTIPFGYITGSALVYKDGLLLTPTIDYTESDPINGEITFTVAPATGVQLIVTCLTLAA